MITEAQDTPTITAKDQTGALDAVRKVQPFRTGTQEEWGGRRRPRKDAAPTHQGRVPSGGARTRRLT